MRMDVGSAVALYARHLLVVRETVLEIFRLANVDGTITIWRSLLREDVIPRRFFERRTDWVNPVLVLFARCARPHDRLFGHLLPPFVAFNLRL